MDTEGLLVICAGLGSIEEDDDNNTVGYAPREYCLDNLKDLLRFLRRDDPETRDVFKQVCKWSVVGTHLIPIIEFCQDDRNLVLNAVKVLVFLTMPVEASSKDVNQQLEYLWGIKYAISHSDVVAVVVSLLEKPLENLECNTFSEDDWKLVQLVLTLFRNILAVQDISVNQSASGSANQLLSLRDDFLERLFKENVMDFIIIITQHIRGSCRYLRHDNLLLLEIYHYIFKGQDPELIVEGRADSKVKGNGVDSLETFMQEEAAKRRRARMHAIRHSQFSGTFTRLTLDGSKTMCKGVPTSASCDKLLKSEKVHRGPSKKVVKDYARVPTTKRSLLEMLHDYINQFLTGGYNVLMQSIAEDIEKEHHAVQSSDVIMFFHLAQFVTSFQYHKSVMAKPKTEINYEPSVSDDDGDDSSSTWFKGDMCGPIAATMNEPMFGLVIAKWQFAFDGLKETKNNAFLSVAGSLLKIMIRMLDLVLKLMPENSKEPQTARIILYKLFYDQSDHGLTQFLLHMFRSFDAHKQPKSDLADLVEITHVIIRLMEKLQAHGTLRVAKKARKARKKKTDETRNIENGTVGDDVTIQNEMQCPGNEETLNGEASEKETSTQTACDGKEENVDVPVQDEMGISMAEGENVGGSPPLGDHEESKQNPDNFVVTGADNCDSSADEQLAAKNEVDFKMRSWLLSIASCSIISNLCWLLKFYKNNSTATNHYIISLLRRICDDLDLAPMLYQITCLVIFYDILDEQKARPQKEHENIVQFLTSLVRRMLRKMKNQPLLFVDVLFWKTRKDCQYINAESIQRDVNEMRKEVRKWDGVGEAGPSQDKQSNMKSLADALGDDEYDVIMSSEHHYEKDEEFDETAVQILQSGVDGHYTRKEHPLEDEFEGVIKRKRRLVLNDKLEEQIRDLHEKYKDNLDCIQLIAKALGPDGNISPAQVSRKCKKLGLQLPSKKSINVDHISHGSDDHNEATAEVDSTLPDSNHPDGPSVLRRHKHSRKRVCAIDENQELKIRSFFKQFKDHKRCSHMIASELDPNGAVTAAQVSRKLKKLGLHTSRMRFEAKSQNVNEADASADGEDDSDNETLSLLMKRSKSTEGKSNVAESPGHSSDDELILSTVLMKSRRAHSELEDKHAGTSTDQDVDGQNFESQTARDSIERDDRGQEEGTNTNGSVPFPNSPSSRSEHQATGTSSGGESSLLFTSHKYDESTDLGIGASDDSPGSSPESDVIATPSGKRKGLELNDNSDALQNELGYNELEDSADEQPPSASPKSSVKRRKLRVVLDFDDDE